MFLWIILIIVLFYIFSKREGFENFKLEDYLKGSSFLNKDTYFKSILDKKETYKTLSNIKFDENKLGENYEQFFNRSYGVKDDIFTTIDKYDTLLKNINLV